MGRGSAVAGAEIRPLRAVDSSSVSHNRVVMDDRELQQTEKWLLNRAMEWFTDPEVSDAIGALADSGSDLGIRYRRYQREVRTLAQAWGLNRPRPTT